MPAVLGQVTVPPGAAPAHLTDRINAIIVELANGTMQLHDADNAALAAGANLAIVGDELLQFAHAVPLGGRKWSLRGLWRGRRGTEQAIGSQAPGDRFVLLDADALTIVDLPVQAVGGTMRVFAQGVMDAEAAEAQAQVRGASLMPPAPVHLRVRPLPDGTTEIHWVRRSRNGWQWIDGVDSPLGEESERYRITLTQTAGAVSTSETSESRIVLSAADRAATANVGVRQIGAHGLSPSATLDLPISGEG
jgi:hypothetical protein